MFEWNKYSVDFSTTGQQDRWDYYDTIPQIHRHFTFSQSSGASNRDLLSASVSYGAANDVYVLLGATSTYTWYSSMMSGSQLYVSGNMKIYIRTATIGNIDIIRFSVTPDFTEKTIDFVFSTGKNIDTDEDCLVSWTNGKTAAASPNGELTQLHTANNATVLSTLKYDASNPVRYTSYALGKSDNNILQKVYFNGVDTGFYSIDGGQNVSDWALFTIGNNTFLCIGISLAVKVS